MARYTDTPLTSQSTTDLVFGLHGKAIPIFHGINLLEALLPVLPWLEDCPQAGIHAIKGAATEHGTLLLSKRATLTLRLPMERAAEAEALAGSVLSVGGDQLTLETAKLRPVAAHPAISARYVCLGSENEGEFSQKVGTELGALGIHCEMVVGHQWLMPGTKGKTLSTFTLALYDLKPEESLLLMEKGLGTDRLLGCGVFVPHKSFAAVGN